MRIAVVHDYFTQSGGAERVAEVLFQILPNADLHTTVALPERLPASLKDVPISTSWMQALPGMRKFYRQYFLLYPFSLSSFDLSGYDLVISSSSGYVKGVSPPLDTLHVCYCHTPMRWAWSFDGYSKREEMNPATRTVLRALVALLRTWDREASRQPDHFVANSRGVAARIQRVYGRSAEVIYPPIDVHRFRPTHKPAGGYYMVLSRLIGYKRLDLAVEACTKLGRELLVVGDGPHRRALESIAGPTVKFLGRVSDDEVVNLAANCRALIFPGEEDFGMAPLEVAAAGRPTIAYRAGGATETVIDGVTGLFFDAQSPEHVMEAIERLETRTWSPIELRLHAEEFSIAVFQERFFEFLTRIGCPLRGIESLTRVTPSLSVAENWIGEDLRTA